MELQWPFDEWGVDLVLQGHDHTYERMIRGGVPYVIDGRGGRSLYYVGTPVAGSRIQYNGSYGTSILDFDGDWLHLRALNIDGALVDEWHLHVDGAQLEGSVAGAGPWSYLDDDQPEELGWTEVGFDDDAWSSGSGPFGYGLPGLRTEIAHGETTVDDTGDTAGPVTTRAITAYFRHEFVEVDPSVYAFAELQLACDDGCIAYLNGTEIVRHNMPTGAVDEETTASSSVYSDARTRFGFAVDPALLNAGPNVLAVEVHQADSASADAWVEAELIGFEGTVVLDSGADWTYALAPAAGFEAEKFDDSGWSSGPSPLGAALADLGTELKLGKKPPLSAGFRHTLTVETEPEAWLLRMRRDDGARVFVDGTEIWRSNLALNGLVIDSPAASAIGSYGGDLYLDLMLPGDALPVGEHVLAGELHQATGGESDLVFDLQVIALDLP